MLVLERQCDEEGLVHTITKLDVVDRTAAVMAAIQRGLLHPAIPVTD